MALEVDEKWLREYYTRIGKAPPGSKQAAPAAQDPQEPKRQKYGNQKTESGGKKFDSKHEAKIYEELRLRCLAGEYIGLALQVPFYLPGGIKYVADFVAFLPDGTYAVMDAKSDATRKDKVYRLKRRLMQECLKIIIQEV